jgi:hypothetical protein
MELHPMSIPLSSCKEFLLDCGAIVGKPRRKDLLGSGCFQNAALITHEVHNRVTGDKTIII